MNHAEIIKKTTELFNAQATSRMPESAIREVIQFYTDAMFLALAEGHRVTLRDIGRLEVKYPKGRLALNKRKSDYGRTTLKSRVEIDTSSVLDRVINTL